MDKAPRQLLSRVAFIGFGFYWASDYVGFQSTSLFSAASDSMALINTFFLTSLCVSVIMHFMFAYIYHRFPRKVDGGPSPITLAACLSIAYCGVCLSSILGSAARPVLIASSMMHGFFFAWIDVLWLGYFGRMVPEDSRRRIFISFIASIVLYFIAVWVATLGPYVGLVVLLVYVAVTGLALDRGMRDLASDGSVQRFAPSPGKSMHLRKALWQPLVGIAAFSIIYAFLDRFTSQGAVFFNQMHMLSLSGCLLASIGLLIAIRIPKRRFDLNSVCKVALPILIVGCLLPFTAFGSGPMWPMVLVAVGFTMVDIMIIALAAELAYEYDVDGAILGGISRGVVIGFAGLGGSIGYSVIDVSMSIVVSIMIAMIFVYLAIVGGSIILRQKNTSTLNDVITSEQGIESQGTAATRFEVSPSASDDVTAGKLIRAANAYSLTKREQEVYSYLVHGRSLVYIADALVLSEHTVRTHIRHIYEKADVHSKQELIDKYDAL